MMVIVLSTLKRMNVRYTFKVTNNAFGLLKIVHVYNQRIVVNMNTKIKIFACHYPIANLMDKNVIVAFKQCFHLNK